MNIENLRKMYMELLKKCLLGQIIQDKPLAIIMDKGIDLFPSGGYNPSIRYYGRDWPGQAHTMIGKKRLDNLQDCVEKVIIEEVPGDLIETGVWRGGATILMRGILKVYGIKDRCVWVADSFEGLPAPNSQKYPADKNLFLNKYNNVLGIPLEEVKNNFQLYDLLDNQVCFLKGWFKDTLPNVQIKQLAVLRLDGDLYESTFDALKYLYPKLSVGGYLIIDDYNINACAQAVNDYRSHHNITENIIDIDGYGIYWKRR